MSNTVDSHWAIDRRSGEALSRQLAAHLRAAIRSGRFAAGQRLGSVRDLAQRHGLSTQTVAEAYSQLVTSGLVVARRGSGYFVSELRETGPTLPLCGDAEQLDPRRLRSEITAGTDGAVRLGAGVPASWHDHSEIEAIWRRSLRGGFSQFADYGGTRGYEPLRRAVAAGLESRGIHATPAQVLLTAGATQAIDLVVRVLARAGDAVLVDDPGYFQTHLALKLHGARVIGVPRTASGPDVEALDRLCREWRPRLFFTQSALQNPTGSALSLATAYELLRVAERHELTVVEDDVSGDLAPEHLPRLAMLDQLSRVVYVGSFSKSLSPSLRVGYLATRAAPLMEALAQTRLVSTFVGCEPNEAFVHTLITEGHYARHVKRLRQRLADRAAFASSRLTAMGFEPGEGGGTYVGGTFLWLRHPRHAEAMPLADAAARAHIFLAPGSAFRPDQGPSAYFRFALPLCEAPALDALEAFLGG